jgi:tRNA (pseudouridine54-N1)-methyltransferase
MRQFVVIGHEVPITEAISLDDLPGAGRADLLLRCVGAALFTSHDIRTDTTVHLVLQDRVTVTFDGETIRHARPDERSLGGLLRTALDSLEDAIGHQPAEPAAGIGVRRRGFEATVEALNREGTILALADTGRPLHTLSPPSNPIFVLSDHQDFTERDRAVLDETAAETVSVGPRVIHADHTTAIVHNWLDTEGYTRY